MKKKYESAEIKLILFGLCDVITLSVPNYPDKDEDGNAGGGIGGGYNPNGWT